MNNQEVLRNACIMSFKRRERFISGYDIDKELINLYLIFFENNKVLYHEGLIPQYRKLKEKVIKDKLIGLILYGNLLEEKSDKNIYINLYVTMQNKFVKLTIKNISHYLLKDFFDDELINKLCRETPNINIYLKE